MARKFEWMAVKLVILCFAIFMFQQTYPITPYLALVSAKVLFRPWTLVTHIFLHGGPEHLLYNMFALALFGSILERIIGWRKFLLVFFASGIIAGFGSLMFYSASLGASGAIFGILGTLTLLRPKMTVFVGMIPMPMALAAVFWALGDLVGMFVPSGVANAAHLFGLAFGLIFGFYLRQRYGMKYFEKHKKDEEPEVSEEEFEQWEEHWM